MSHGKGMFRPCQCEHAAHQSHSPVLPTGYTPNGNPGHRYGTKFHYNQLRKIRTTYGTFEVCRDCATDCHHGE